MSAIANDNFERLPKNYLFAEIGRRTEARRLRHPGEAIIKLGVGDVTRPLAPVIIEAMHKAVDELASKETFKGYGPEHGYMFLREAIATNDYKGLGIRPTDIFVSEGAICDGGNVSDIFGKDATAGITTPVYPVYLEANIMAGRQIRFIPCNASNDYTGDIPSEAIDIIYLCYPNNPTGAAISRSRLKEWVDYALKNGSIIVYDGAYEAFIRESELPRSIYEIEGAKYCAIELRSFSKTAGFTGVRCAYSVVPEELGKFHSMWAKRQECRFNGVSYITQRGAEAVYTPEGRRQTREAIDYYAGNAAIIREPLVELGLEPVGGVNSPYIWARTPGSMKSWDFFDLCLEKAGVVITPGVGFGESGEGYFRISSFGEREDTAKAMQLLKSLIYSL